MDDVGGGVKEESRERGWMMGPMGSTKKKKMM